jgi:hypothetical protein
MKQLESSPLRKFLSAFRMTRLVKEHRSGSRLRLLCVYVCIKGSDP